MQKCKIFGKIEIRHYSPGALISRVTSDTSDVVQQANEIPLVAIVIKFGNGHCIATWHGMVTWKR